MYGTSLPKRIGISTVIIAVVYYMVCKSPPLLYVASASAFIVFSLFEFFSIIEKNNIAVDKKLGLILGGLFPWFFYLGAEGIFLAISTFVLLVVHFGKKERSAAFIKTVVTLFGLLYVAWLFSFIVKLKFLEEGTKWVAYIIWVTKMGDAGAYFIGTSFGKRKLYAQVSPKKSIEGALGGLLFSCIVSLSFKVYIPSVPIVHFLILGIVIGIFAQIGDFTESLIKRELSIKDSGSIPGLGGVLDIIDSLLFTVPFLFYYLTAIIQV